MVKKSFLFIFVFILIGLAISFVSASKIAYVIKTPSPINADETTIINILKGDGHNVTLLDDVIFNASLYDLIIVGSDVDNINSLFDNKKSKTLFLSSTSAKNAGLGRYGGTTSGSKITISDNLNRITENFALGDLNVQDSLNPINYLYGCRAINSQSLAYKTYEYRDVILLLRENSLLFDATGSCSKRNVQIYKRNMFFGIPQASGWNSDAKDLFINSIDWLIEGEDVDGDGYYYDIDCNDNNAEIWQNISGYIDSDSDGFGVGSLLQVCSREDLLEGYSKIKGDCNDGNSVINPDAEEIPYNEIDDDCNGFDLADIDNDKYCEEGYNIQNKTLQCNKETSSIGSDCDDENLNIYLGAYDPIDDINQNCINDIPILSSNILNKIWYEDTNVENIYDLNDYFKDRDGDLIEYSVEGNANLNIEIIDGLVSLEPIENWFGTEIVRFIASDGSLIKKSNNVSLTVLPINDAPILQEIEDIKVIAGSIVKIVPNATDIDKDILHYSFPSPFDSSGEWKTKLEDVGVRKINVSVRDWNASDIQEVLVEILPKITINEFVPNPLAEEEWIELYNPNNFNINLQDLDFTIEDGTGNEDSLSGTVDAKGVIVIYPNFGLNNPGDIIILKQQGLETDKVAYGNWDDNNISDNAPVTAIGESLGRNPDGKDTDNDKQDFIIFKYPTKGLSNLADVIPPTITLLAPVDDVEFKTDRVLFNFSVSDNKVLSLNCELYSDINGNFMKLVNQTITNGSIGNFYAYDIPEGNYLWNVKCFDNLNYAFAPKNFSFVINDTPYLTSEILNQEWDEDTTKEINLTEYFKDEDNNSLAYSFTGSTNINVNIINAIASLTPKANWSGNEIIRFIACDKEKCKESNNLSLNVLPINDVPVLGHILDINANEGELVRIIANASDVDGNVLNYNINDTRFSQQNNIFELQTGYNDSGVYYVLINVSDGNLSDEQEVKIIVNDKNEPPHINPIPDIQIEEDSEFQIVSENLSVYAYDNDGYIINFNVIEEDTNKVDCNILDGVLRVKPAKNWYGIGDKTTSCIIQVKDDDNAFAQTTFKINVTNVDDKPIIDSYSPQFTPKITENGNQTFSVTWHDIDNIPAEVSVKWYKDNILAGINDYTFVGEGIAKSYNITVVVDDGELQESKSWLLVTSNIPLTEKYNGSTTDFSEMSETDLQNVFNLVLEKKGYEKIKFLEPVDLRDVVDLDKYTEIQHGLAGIDTNVLTSLKNKKARITFFNLNFNKTPTLYYDAGFNLDVAGIICPSNICSNIDYNVLNGTLIFEVSSFSTFIVGETRTCSQQSGFVCSANELCRGNLLEARDTNVCCNVKCVPNFKDAKMCSVLDNKIKIDIKNPNENDKLKPRETIDGEIKIENYFDEDKSFNVEVFLYDLTKNNEVDSADKKASIDKGNEKKVELSLQIPEDIEENEYYLYVKVNDRNNESICNEGYIKLNIEREKNDVIIKDFKIDPLIITPNDYIDLSIKVKNIGSEDQDAYIIIENSELGIKEKSDMFEIEKYDKKDEVERTFSIKIPENASVGNYTIKATVFSNREQNSLSENLVLEESKKPIINMQRIEKVSLGGEKIKAIMKITDTKKINLAILLLISMFFVLITTLYLFYSFYKKTEFEE